MDKEEFRELFRNQLEIAAQNAEERFKVTVPRNFKIRLFPRATSRGHKLYDLDAALGTLYLDGQLFPLYIDVAVEAVSINKQFTVVYVGADTRDRVPFELTWNYKSAGGPFKQQINEELIIIAE